jgi:hypothetical protein
VVAEVHQQVADLLGRPRPVRVGGDPGDVHVACTAPEFGARAVTCCLASQAQAKGHG